jgi:hypothetical protein
VATLHTVRSYKVNRAEARTFAGWATLLLACLLFWAFLVAVACTAVADTTGEGGTNPKCIVMGGYAGECTNTGRVVEGYIMGCVTDFEGDYHYATIGASFHGGAIRMIAHKPFYDRHVFWNGGKADRSYEWNDGRQLSAGYVSFSIVREAGSPQTWLSRAWVRCCDCDEKGQR